MTREHQQFELALDQLRLGNYQSSIEHFKSTLSENPENALAHAYLSISLHDTKRLHAADYEADIALGLAPEEAMPHFSKGLVLLARQHYEAANACFMEAIDLDPDNAFYHGFLATTFEAMGEKGLSLSTLKEGLRKNPQDVDILSAIGTYYMEQDDIKQAKTYALEALHLDPESKEANTLQGSLLLREGDSKQAREHAIMALRYDADYHPAQALLCGIKMKLNPLFGLWWRYHIYISRFDAKGTLVLLMLFYVLYRVSAQLLIDFNHQEYSFYLFMTWLFFCGYTWFSGWFFNRSLNKERGNVRMKEDF